MEMTIANRVRELKGSCRDYWHSVLETSHLKAIIIIHGSKLTSVSNVWLVKRLNMGIPQGVRHSTRKIAGSKVRQHKKYIEMRKVTG